jgi:hypothetical protein
MFGIDLGSLVSCGGNQSTAGQMICFGCGSFTTTFVNSLRQFLLLYTRQILLLDYF